MYFMRALLSNIIHIKIRQIFFIEQILEIIERSFKDVLDICQDFKHV